MTKEGMNTLQDFNARNNFTPLKASLLPYLIACASGNIRESFEYFQPWAAENILSPDRICQPDYYISTRIFKPNSLNMPIDYPSSWSAPGYRERYRTIVPEGFPWFLLDYFSEWEQEDRMMLSEQQFVELQQIGTSDIISQSLTIIEQASPSIISEDKQMLSSILDQRYNSFKWVRICKSIQDINIKYLTKNGSLFGAHLYGEIT